MDINAATLGAVFKALSLAFNQRFDVVNPFYPNVAMKVTSTGAANEYPRLDDIPGWREWIGDRVINQVGGSTFTIWNKTFERTIGIPREKIEDDQLGVYAPLSAQIGEDAKSFPDTLVFPLLKTGETSVCYDGQYFFDIDHPGFDANGAPVNVSNYTSGAGPAWYLIDDTKVVKPFIYQERRPIKLTPKFNLNDDNVFFQNQFIWGADGRMNAGYGMWQLAYKSGAALNAANYSAAKAAMSSQFRRDGSPFNIRPSLILVPPALEMAAKNLFTSTLVNGGESNPFANECKVLVVPHLA